MLFAYCICFRVTVDRCHYHKCMNMYTRVSRLTNLLINHLICAKNRQTIWYACLNKVTYLFSSADNHQRYLNRSFSSRWTFTVISNSDEKPRGQFSTVTRHSCSRWLELLFFNLVSLSQADFSHLYHRWPTTTSRACLLQGAFFFPMTNEMSNARPNHCY